ELKTLCYKYLYFGAPSRRPSPSMGERAPAALNHDSRSNESGDQAGPWRSELAAVIVQLHCWRTTMSDPRSPRPLANPAPQAAEERVGADDFGLSGKVAIVTGGGAPDDGIGNGRAAAMLLARAGARVLVVD